MKIHFSSKTDAWETPQRFFDILDAEFHFTLDVCASDNNKKVKHYFNKGDNGLEQDWGTNICWMNPPYGREIGKWIKKASEARGGAVVCLLPARTDTRYFHEYIYKNPRATIRFIKGRLKFSNNKNSAPFPSMVVIFK